MRLLSCLLLHETAPVPEVLQTEAARHLKPSRQSRTQVAVTCFPSGLNRNLIYKNLNRICIDILIDVRSQIINR